ncbi:8-oxo-dGTP pyrophosphatase MutT (NUDIX family) [Aquamicrobium terrae]
MSDLMERVAARDSAGEITQQQYGALPWRLGRKGIEVLLITSRRRGRWIVPKGWLVKGRSPAQSAAREAFEEAGVIGRAYPAPIGDYVYMKFGEDGSAEPCRVTLFSLHVQGTLINWREKEQRQRRWCAADEAPDVIAEPDLSRLVEAWQSRLKPSAGGKP